MIFLQQARFFHRKFSLPRKRFNPTFVVCIRFLLDRFLLDDGLLHALLLLLLLLLLLWHAASVRNDDFLRNAFVLAPNFLRVGLNPDENDMRYPALDGYLNGRYPDSPASLQTLTLILGMDEATITDSYPADPTGCNALALAVNRGYTNVVKKMCKCPSAGRVVNVRNSVGETPLHTAAFKDDECMLISLLVAKADPTLTTNNGTTALQLAQRHGRADKREDYPRLFRWIKQPTWNPRIHGDFPERVRVRIFLAAVCCEELAPVMFLLATVIDAMYRRRTLPISLFKQQKDD